MSINKIIEQLQPFSDIGTQVAVEDGKILMQRNDSNYTISIKSNKLTLSIDGQTITTGTLQQLLASDHFAALSRWARSQKDYIERTVFNKIQNDPLSIKGRIDSNIFSSIGIEEINDHLAIKNSETGANILLIDGPAGIGKTWLIHQLAHSRAVNYEKNRAPLILHVQSRGRVLSFIHDLMAFSLQSLRVPVTYDQITTLVRNNLIILAIDGFDELGDPSGYSLAWAQLSDIINETRGGACTILAGRETFIGKDRIYRDVSALNPENDKVNVLTLIAPSPSEAKSWLKNNGWTDETVENCSEILEANSYALRPFFLSQLSKFGDSLNTIGAGNPLPFLMDALTQRETTKFGESVEKYYEKKELEELIKSFLGEVARDMAENQSESIDESTLCWLMEACAKQDTPEPIKNTLIHRASVIAFITNDDRKGKYRFFTSQFMDYFLCMSMVRSLSDDEIPKYIRRNIIGPNVLSSMSQFMENFASTETNDYLKFINKCQSIIKSYNFNDRTKRNLSAILLASVVDIEENDGMQLDNLEIDDAVTPASVPSIKLRNCRINQLDLQGADISNIEFNDSSIASLIGGETTRLPPNFPRPSMIESIEQHGTRLIIRPEEIEDWIQRRLGSEESEATPLFSAKEQSSEMFKLFQKVCRFRQYWIGYSDDQISKRIVNDPNWEDLKDIFVECGLLREEKKSASGNDSLFFHIRRKDELTLPPSDKQIADFHNKLRQRIGAQLG